MENYADILNDCEAPCSVSSCQKDVGERYKLRSWSRGHFFIVRTCGYIEAFRPLFQYVK